MAFIESRLVSNNKVEMNSVRPLSTQLQEKAKKELNEKPNSIESDIKAIKEWLAKQPHLKTNAGK